MPEKEIAKRLVYSPPLRDPIIDRDPGDEDDDHFRYSKSLVLPAIELAIHGPPKWREEAVRIQAELIFGKYLR